MLQTLGLTYGTQSMVEVFADTGFASAFLEFEYALLKVQEELGLVPQGEAAKLACIQVVDLDLASAAQSALETGSPTSGLVDQIHAAAPYAHYGVAAQDAWDTAHVLQLRRALRLLVEAVRGAVASLSDLTELHAETQMVGRTQGQTGALTTLGFKTAIWLDELLRIADRLSHAAREAAILTLAGSVGTGSAFSVMGGDPDRIEKMVARRLRLRTTVTPWLTARDRHVELASALGQLCTLAGKVGHEIYNLQRTGISELSEGGAAGSSTVPQKMNPWVSQRMHGLAAISRGLVSTVAAAASLPEGEREVGSAYAEWYGLAHLCLVSGRLATDLAVLLAHLEVYPDVMRANLEVDPAVLSEGLSMVLCQAVGKQRGHMLMKEAMKRYRDGVPFRQAVMDAFQQAGAIAPPDTLLRSGVAGWAPERARRVAATARHWLTRPSEELV